VAAVTTTAASARPVLRRRPRRWGNRNRRRDPPGGRPGRPADRAAGPTGVLLAHRRPSPVQHITARPRRPVDTAPRLPPPLNDPASAPPWSGALSPVAAHLARCLGRSPPVRCRTLSRSPTWGPVEGTLVWKPIRRTHAAVHRGGRGCLRRHHVPHRGARCASPGSPEPSRSPTCSAIHPLGAQRCRQRACALPQIARSALLRALRMESAHPDKAAVQRPAGA